jgi:uncharacterized LabA/DUF88 family protein
MSTPTRDPEKAVVLIDGGYLRAIVRDFFQEIPVDLLTLSEELCGGCQRFRTYYYTCPPYQSSKPTLDEQQRASKMDKLLYNLRRLPRFEVRLGRLRKTNDPNRPFEQKGVDVWISIDLTQLSASRTVDQAILLSGDSDLVQAVRVAKENMTLVRLVYHDQRVSDQLFDVCDERVQITKDLIEKARLRESSTDCYPWDAETTRAGSDT